jgi:signal transduction histidine kinase
MNEERKSYALAAPFVVLAVSVAALAAAPLWLEARSEGRGRGLVLLSITVRSIRQLIALESIGVAAAIVGGVIAALMVRRHHRLERTRARELEQFAARVAHDVVSPLGTVGTGLSVLGRWVERNGPAREALLLVHRSLARVTTVVDELFRFARAGAQPAPAEIADVRAVIAALREELLPAAQGRGVELTFEPAPALKVACSEAALLIVLPNLIRNAIKHGGQATLPTVVVSVTVSSRTVRFTVDDWGPGIPPDMQSAIFEPYVRAGRDQSGLGLGLATVKRLVEARGGNVGVSSQPNAGASFWFELPLAT